MTVFLLFTTALLLSAFFSASETALTSISRLRVQSLVEQRKYGARSLSSLKENQSRMVSTIVLADNIVDLGTASLMTALTLQFFESQGMGDIGLVVSLVTGLSTFLILLFGDIIPKTVALRHAELISLFAAPVIEAVAVVLSPVLALLNIVSRPIIHLLGGAVGKGPFLTEDEIKMALSMGEEQGVIEEEEKEMIHGILELADTVVREVMTPRPDMVAIPATTSIAEAVERFIKEGHSRIPVYEGNIDNIAGILYARDVLGSDFSQGASLVRDAMRPPLLVPESKPLDDLMRQMQRAKTHIAIVVDEYGGTAGLVTFEDLVEEIVGEIQDEFDREEKSVQFLDDHTILVDARMSISDASEQLGIEIPEGNYDTVGGFVFSLLGKLASVGDSVKHHGITFTVEKVLRRRVTRVKVIKPLVPIKETEEGVGG